jgi:hypothetical protein
LNFGRLTGLLTAFSILAVVLVHLRAEQNRMTASMLNAQTQRMHLRRELWVLQTRLARAKSPRRILDRIERSDQPDLRPPGADEFEDSSFALTSERSW